MAKITIEVPDEFAQRLAQNKTTMSDFLREAMTAPIKEGRNLLSEA